MKPAPIMEEEEIEEEEMEDQEQTKKKKDLQQTQKPFAWAVGKRALVRDRETHSQRKGDHDEERGGVKEKRTGQDGAARDESEM